MPDGLLAADRGAGRGHALLVARGVADRRGHDEIVVLSGERFRAVVLVVAERQHLAEKLAVGKPLRVQGEYLHKICDRARARLPVGAEAAALAQPVRERVLPLAAVLVRIAELQELHHGIR